MSSLWLPRARARRGLRPTAPASAPAAGVFSDGYDTYGLEGNEAFSPASPTLKDGTAIAGDMLTYHSAYTYWRDNQQSASLEWNLASSSVLGSTNAYDAARRGQPIQTAIMQSFRMTGDLRDLDALCAGFDALQANLTTAWSDFVLGGLVASLCDGASGPNYPYSPYLKLNQSYDANGNDLDRLNQMKLWQLVAEFTWALHLNQDKTSPGGVNYGTRLTYWKARLLDFVKTWSETSNECWAVNNYKGVDAGSTSGISNVTAYRERQTWGLYPFAMRNESHAGLNSLLLHHYLGLLGQHASLGIANPADATIAADEMAAAARTNGYRACTNADHGDSLVFPHNSPFTGGDATPQGSTYMGYQGAALVSMWMVGRWRTEFPTSDMLKLGSAFAWAHDGTTGQMYSRVNRGVEGCGLNADDTGPGATATDNSLKGQAVLPIVFDPGGSKMASIASALMTLSGGSTADRAAIPSALFLRKALEAIGDVS